MSSLPTRLELSARLRSFDVRERRWLIVGIALVVTILANRPIARWFEMRREMVLLTLALELSAMGALLWSATRRARAAGLACPGCDRPFTQSTARRLALSLGRCAFCNASLASDSVPATDTARHRSPVASRSGRVDRAKRSALLARLQAMPHVADTPQVVPASQFFDGNGDDGSIAANLVEHPGVARFGEMISAIEARADVQAVLVAITDLMTDDEGSWPYSDTLYVLTSAPLDDVRLWFAELQPDEVSTGFSGGAQAPPGAPPLAPGMAPIRIWWD